MSRSRLGLGFGYGVKNSSALNILTNQMNLMDKTLQGKSMEVAEQIHKRAMQNLENSMAGTMWGHSADASQRIANTVRFEPTKDGVEVIYDSPHADIVEFGWHNPGTPKYVTGGPFAIGGQQGGPITLSTGFEVQAGYFYLTKAKMEMEAELPKQMKGLFRSILR